MSGAVNGYLDETRHEARVFEGEDFFEEKFFAGAEAYAAAEAERIRVGWYREPTGREARDSLVGEA